MSVLRILLESATIGFLICASALACIHAPLVHKGVVTERLKEAFMFHDGELSHLVVRTSLNAKDGLPESMAWVIPLPSLPTIMEEAGSGLFSELFFLTVPPPPSRRESKAAEKAEAPKAAAAAPALKVHAVTVAGDYRLQPIEILSDAAGEELNAWLTQNGFGSVPPENQRFYLRKGAVFLAVKIAALKGIDSVLKPLHLAYKAERPLLPLKFSSHSGEFDVTLYTLTPEKPRPDALSAFHLEFVHVAEVRGADLELLAPDLQKLIGKRAGWLARFEGVRYNSPGRLVAQLSSDPAFGVAVPVTKMAVSSATIENAQRIGLFAFIAAAVVALTRWRRARQKKPWRIRAALYVALISAVVVGWYMLAESYETYITRIKVSAAYGMVGLVRSEIAERAEMKKSLAGVGAEFVAPEGYSVSRDGVISFELDPRELGMRLKFILTPSMKDGTVIWDCQAFPETAARRLAPTSCRRPE